MAVHRSGRGPDLVLFHGGMGSWKHWIRNVEALGEHFTVHALDHPSYGDSAPVPRETTGPQYLDLVHVLLLEALPGAAPLRFAGFSFGAAIAANMARRLGPRVSHLALISPGGFPMRKFGERPIRSYREAGGDDRLFREVCRHNLLVNMLGELDVDVVRVTVTELRENTFHASITIAQNGAEVEIDSRSSDAIAIAVRAQAPIFAADEVIEESAIEMEGDEVNEEEIVDEFKRFLDKVSAEDFVEAEVEGDVEDVEAETDDEEP